MLASILAVEDHHIPPVDEIIIMPERYFAGTPFAINKVVVIMFIAAIVTILFFGIAFARPKIVPRGLQNFGEVIVDFVRNGVIMEVIGPAGLGFLPFLTTMFAFIFVNNIFSIIPAVNYPATARLAIPGVLAILVWFIFQIVGIINQGPAWYVRTVWPSSVPIAIRPLYALIELVAVFLIRPFSLAVRLGANMIAGHVMLTVFFIFAYNFIEPRISILVGIPAFLLATALVVFEILVALLQAYIFTILTAVYIGESMHHDH